MMPLIYTGRPAPFDGKRKLTAKEAMQRAKAMACIRSARSTECQGQIFVGLFFDGTGNNDNWVEKGYSESQRMRNKHSNVARLMETFINEPGDGFFRVYIPGVGTPFQSVGDTTDYITDNAGSGFAYKGADRICWAISSLFNAVHRYLTGQPMLSAEDQKKLVNLMSSAMLAAPIFHSEGVVRWSMLTTLEEKLSLVVKRHQKKVQQINVSLFGFSRGAAQARACAHWLHQVFEIETGAFELAGVPIRIGFMGIFDTVAAVGIGDLTPVTFGHMAWADGTQSIHPSVEECTHFIALHEQRASFPLESATGRGNVGYPGMHSDVGGGYWPGEQGKAMGSWGPSPHISQIPLIDMHFTALKAGVPLLTIEEINANPALKKSFATDDKLIVAYNKWVATNDIPASEIAEFTQAHTNQYLRWRGSLHTEGGPKLVQKRFFKEATGTDRKDLAEADKNLGLMLLAWRERHAANVTRMGRAAEMAKAMVRLVPAGLLLTAGGMDPLSTQEARFFTLLTAGPLPPKASIDLFEDYVHDSRAGFRVLAHHEPEWLTGGYARYRNIFVQGKPDDRTHLMANESLKVVKSTAGATVDFFQKISEFTVDSYGVARQKIYRAAQAINKGVVDAAQAAEVSTSNATNGIKSNSGALGKRVISRANEAAKVYDMAQRKVLQKSIKSQEELLRQWRARFSWPDE